MPHRKNSVVAVLNAFAGVPKTIEALQKAGFDMRKVSIVGCSQDDDEQVFGYYDTGKRLQSWGALGDTWDGIWDSLVGSAIFFIPGIGPVLIGGPLVEWLISTLEKPALVSGVSAMGAAFYNMGIPKDIALQYESSLKSGKVLVVVHGKQDEVEQACEILNAENLVALNVHQSGG